MRSLNKLPFTIYILICVLALFVSCTPSAAEPTAEPERAKRVQIRLQNNSNTNFDQVELRYPEETAVFGPLPSGSLSDYQGFNEAFQSAEIIATAGNTTHTLPPFEIEFEREFPITSGSYTLNLTLPENRLAADWQPEQPDSLTPLISQLEAGVFSVRYEPSIKRRTIFDDLFGQVVTQQEFLYLNDARVDVYIFADEAMAQEAASTIQGGGTIFNYTRPDGETVSLTMDMMAGAQPTFWQNGRFLIHTSDPAAIQPITTALGSVPIGSSPNSGAAVEVRLVNLSDIDFDNVVVNFLDQEIAYGPLPSRGTTGYQTTDLAYRYAYVRATAAEQTYEFQPIDYVGEATLAPGQHSYFLTVIDTYLDIAHIQDDNLVVDEGLLGTPWTWVEGKTAENQPITIATIDRDPTLQFTTDPEPNGERGFVLTGYNGCNGFGGAYLPSNSTPLLVIPGLAQTEQGCQEEVAAAERFMMDALNGVVYYQVDGNQLTLTTPAGATLTFTR